MRLARVRMKRLASAGIGRVRLGCDCIWFRVEAYTLLVLETIIHGRLKDTPMYNAFCVISEDLESHHIPNTGGNTNPPACFLLGGREGLVRIKIENLFIESIFKESGDVLKSTISSFLHDLIPKSFISTHIVDISDVFTCKEPTFFGITCAVKENLGVVLEELHSMEFGGVLLRIFRFCKMILDKVL